MRAVPYGCRRRRLAEGREIHGGVWRWSHRPSRTGRAPPRPVTARGASPRPDFARRHRPAGYTGRVAESGGITGLSLANLERGDGEGGGGADSGERWELGGDGGRPTPDATPAMVSGGDCPHSVPQRRTKRPLDKLAASVGAHPDRPAVL